MQNTFPIITKEMQQTFERCWINGVAYGEITAKEIPLICGVSGRACRQMDKESGACTMNCMYCPLARFAEKMTDIQFRLFIWAKEEILQAWKHDENIWFKLNRIEEYVKINEEYHVALVDYCHSLLED